ncbi:hypothetical protein J6590_070635 [Homalodisca vitripennis]|nr:hypothetical protein J6590_070635 [Homalodisca vitripennis]
MLMTRTERESYRQTVDDPGLIMAAGLSPHRETPVGAIFAEAVAITVERTPLFPMVDPDTGFTVLALHVADT